MFRNMRKRGVRGSLTLLALVCLIGVNVARAQNPAESRAAGATPDREESIITGIFRQFYTTYRIGPADEIAIRIKGQPDYSIDKIKVSPVGSVYHPLLGEVSVAGMTIDQVRKEMTRELSEYLIDPEVSIELIEAQSAKVGVLGEVAQPGIVVLTRPMTVLDVITERGGISPLGDMSDITVLRQDLVGKRSAIKVNLKKVLSGKAKPEENIAVRAGDTIIVDGNMKRRLQTITSVVGFANLLTFLALGGRF
ncbi:MAG: polysaccharide biosynthesis/export family protein [Blastocatellales bacterium]